MLSEVSLPEIERQSSKLTMELLKSLEGQMERINQQQQSLEKIVRVSKTLVKNGSEFQDTEKRVFEDIGELAMFKTSDKTVALKQLLGELTSLNSMMVELMTNTLFNPLQQIQSELKKLDEKQHRAKSARDAFDQSQRKHIGATAKDKAGDTFIVATGPATSPSSNSGPLGGGTVPSAVAVAHTSASASNRDRASSKAADSAAAARKQFESSATDYLASAKNIDISTKIQLLDAICSYMFATLSYHKQGLATLTEAKPFLLSLMTSLDEERARLEKNNIPFLGKSASVIWRATASRSVQINEKQGYLLIQQPNKSKRWKVRWVTVADGYLSWLRKYRKAVSGGLAPDSRRLKLSTCQVREADIAMTSRPYCLEIVSADTKHPLLLKADSHEEQMDWLEVLRSHIHNALIADVNAHAPPQPPATVSPMQQVLQRNPQCADCRAPNPEWASLRYGVTLCSECSSVHRSFGTHISRVKGLVYDRWDEDQLGVLLALGNNRANELFEADVPADVDRPSATTERRTREKFIIQKYREKAFVPKSGYPKATADLNRELLRAAAVPQCDLSRIMILLNLGAEAGVRTEDGRTLLHLAAQNSSAVLLEFAALHSIDVNSVDSRGQTPLHVAAVVNHSKSVRILMSRGANAEATDLSGKLPVDYATLPTVVQLLALSLKPVSSEQPEQKPRRKTDSVIPQSLSQPIVGAGATASPHRRQSRAISPNARSESSLPVSPLKEKEPAGSPSGPRTSRSEYNLQQVQQDSPSSSPPTRKAQRRPASERSAVPLILRKGPPPRPPGSTGSLSPRSSSPAAPAARLTERSPPQTPPSADFLRFNPVSPPPEPATHPLSPRADSLPPAFPTSLTSSGSLHAIATLPSSAPPSNASPQLSSSSPGRVPSEPSAGVAPVPPASIVHDSEKSLRESDFSVVEL